MRVPPPQVEKEKINRLPSSEALGWRKRLRGMGGEKYITHVKAQPKRGASTGQQRKEIPQNSDEMQRDGSSKSQQKR